MKLNTVFLFLCLIISIASEIELDSYSIDSFRDYLEEEGLLEIIESILKAYNQDVAILSCEELVENRKGNLDPSNQYPPSIHTRGTENDNIKCIKKNYIIL